jgi:phosphinothricin acetyltransferase
MAEGDWPEVVEIYRQGIMAGNATFETGIPTFAEWDSAHIDKCRVAAEMGGAIAGWAALARVSDRRAYSGVAEVSVYVAQRFRGQNIGKALLEALIEESEKNGYWTLQSVILAENAASIALHRRCGFRTVGYRERIGRDAEGAWRNTLLMERRSAAVGLD